MDSNEIYAILEEMHIHYGVYFHKKGEEDLPCIDQKAKCRLYVDLRNHHYLFITRYHLPLTLEYCEKLLNNTLVEEDRVVCPFSVYGMRSVTVCIDPYFAYSLLHFSPMDEEATLYIHCQDLLKFYHEHHKEVMWLKLTS